MKHEIQMLSEQLQNVRLEVEGNCNCDDGASKGNERFE